MLTRLIRLLAVAFGVAVLVLVVSMTSPGTRVSMAADPSPTAAVSPAVTLPPSVGAPGTTNAGTTIRGAIGVIIGFVIVIIGWRRRRRGNAKAATTAPDKGLPRR